MRSNYWSDSKFVKKITGYDRPYALTSDEWDKWHADTKKAYPIRYWFSEVFVDWLQDVVFYIPDKIHKIFYWYNNRFVEQRHVLKTGLKAGEWHEFDTRVLHGVFNELVDFVEVEKAFHHVAQDKEKRKEYKPPWWRFGKLGFYLRGWRCPQAGIDYLLWEASLKNDSSMGIKPTDPDYGKPSSQAEAADETLYLYIWWKNRKYRYDPEEVSGLNVFYDSGLPRLRGNWTPQRNQEWRELHAKARTLEEQYYDEDTQMLTRLIKVRSDLWT